MFVRRMLLVLAVATAAVVASAGIAWAATFQTSTSFGFVQNPDGVLGDISSAGPSACEQGRRVKLFQKRRGADRLIGSDRSNAGGQWEIDHNLQNGKRYYAKIPRKDLSGPDSCGRYRTSALRFPSGTP
jgi:hypothetical protein